MSEKEGPFLRYHQDFRPKPLEDRQQRPEVAALVDALDDTQIEKLPERWERPTTYVPAFLQSGDFEPVYRRALLVLQKQHRRRERLRFTGPYYSDRGQQKLAMTVAAYHVGRHTPRQQRTKDWPADAFALAELLKIDVAHVREAIYQTQYHRWEERYLPRQSQPARVSQIKDALLHDVLRQNSVEDPSKVNANLYRTALQAEGAMIGSQKAVQVNVNSNVLNLPEGLTERDLRERLERVNRLAAALKPVEAEATVAEEGEPREREEHDPAGDAQRP